MKFLLYILLNTYFMDLKMVFSEKIGLFELYNCNVYRI